MQFNGPTIRVPPTVPERMSPPGVVVENQLRIWAVSRWRGAEELAAFFLRSCFSHLPPGAPRMYRLRRQYDGDRRGLVVGLYISFTNFFDARALLGQVFWIGCEFIMFTVYNIYTDFSSIFRNTHPVHTLPYHFPVVEDLEE